MDYIAKVNGDIYFGKYPCNEVLQALKELDIKTIVDLTHFTDNLNKYEVPEGMNRIVFPIVDMSIEKDKETVAFIILLRDILKDGKIYIHCKGGHGRSGVITALLYGYTYNISGEQSLLVIKEAHSKRKTMHPKMRKMGSPQMKSQKKQVLKLLSPYIIEEDSKFVTCVKGWLPENNLTEVLYSNINTEIKNEIHKSGIRPFIFNSLIPVLGGSDNSIGLSYNDIRHMLKFKII